MANLQNAPSTIGDGFKNVTTAGTRVALVSSSTPVVCVTVTATSSNTGQIVVGGSTVVAAGAGTTRRGTPLSANESYTLYIDDLADVYIDATVNGEGVTFSYQSA